MDIDELIDAAARAAVEDTASAEHAASEREALLEHAASEREALLEHGKEAKHHVWEMHYANATMRAYLHKKLAASPPAFQAAVAAVETILADELAEDNKRRAAIRAEYPTLFKDYE